MVTDSWDDELRFFSGHEGALPIYCALRDKLMRELPETRLEVRRTQISFRNRRLYGCASFLPALKKAARPDPFLTVTFGLDRPLGSDRVAVVTEAQPNRWTHHVVVGSPEEIDRELMGWLRDAYEFAGEKRKGNRNDV